jgi:hypothetical protein
MVSLQESFFIGGAAACTAVTVSNPFEVAKVRMQLQGEPSKNGGERVYRNVGDVLSKTWRNEGIRGLQRGLVPAVCLLSLRCLLCELMGWRSTFIRYGIFEVERFPQAEVGMVWRCYLMDRD